MFLLDYADYAHKLFAIASTPKLALEITKGKWSEYQHTLLQFLELPNIELNQTCEGYTYPTGRYHNPILNQIIEISGDYLITPNGGRKRIIPKSKKEFSLSDIPIRIQIDEERLVLTGEQICEQWTTKGTVFNKIIGIS
jgi:hypothetical protein